MASLRKNLADKFLEELKRKQNAEKSDTMKSLGKKFQFKLALAEKNNDTDALNKLKQQAAETLKNKLVKKQ